MRKVLIAFSIAAFSFLGANAQKSEGFHFAGGLRAGLPIGTTGDFYSFGIGAELQGEYGFSENLTGVVSAGYTNLMGKTIMGEKVASAGLIPVLAGVRFYPSTNVFVGAKAGVTFGSGSMSGSGFTYEPQIGYNAEKFQVAVGYNAITNEGGGSTAHIGATFVYKFN